MINNCHRTLFQQVDHRVNLVANQMFPTDKQNRFYFLILILTIVLSHVLPSRIIIFIYVYFTSIGWKKFVVFVITFAYVITSYSNRACSNLILIFAKICWTKNRMRLTTFLLLKTFSYLIEKLEQKCGRRGLPTEAILELCPYNRTLIIIKD